MGPHWRVRPSAEWPIKHTLADVNHWKVQAHSILKAEFAGDMTLGIFGRNSNGKRVGARYHTDLADQLCSEFCVKTESKLQTVYEWKLKSMTRDNEALDCLVGCMVGASQEGIESSSSRTPEATRKRRSRGSFMSEYMKNFS